MEQHQTNDYNTGDGKDSGERGGAHCPWEGNLLGECAPYVFSYNIYGISLEAGKESKESKTNTKEAQEPSSPLMEVAIPTMCVNYLNHFPWEWDFYFPLAACYDIRHACWGFTF